MLGCVSMSNHQLVLQPEAHHQGRMSRNSGHYNIPTPQAQMPYLSGA